MSRDIFRFHVGELRCTIIQDAVITNLPLSFFVTNPPPPRERLRIGITDLGVPVRMGVYCMLVEGHRRRMLVDTGYGSERGALMRQLKMLDIEPGGIDIVVSTHAHPDHIGGFMTSAGAPAFPGAQHVMLKREFEYWTNSPALGELRVDDDKRASLRRVAENALTAVHAQLDVVNTGAEILPGIVARDAYGHSPGQMTLDIVSGDDTLVFAADVLILASNLPYPEAIAMTDHHPEDAVASRRRLLERAAAGQALVATSHLPFPGVGRVRSHGDAWQWDPLLDQARNLSTFT
jgi:glyoxylase-like metal-dependent hydrolase (beta-lactamase superfamily II)